MSADDDAVGYEQARRLQNTIAAAGISRQRLWMHYFSIGGDVTAFEVDAYLHHSLTLPALQRDLLAHAANELVDEQRPPRAPYASDLQDQSTTDQDAASDDPEAIDDADVMDRDSRGDSKD